MKTINTSHESIKIKRNLKVHRRKKDVAYNKLIKQQAHLVCCAADLAGDYRKAIEKYGNIIYSSKIIKIPAQEIAIVLSR